MNRGNRRARIFEKDDDCLLFIEMIEETVKQHGVEIHAYSLMPNHYHLLVRSPRASLSSSMKWLGQVYTQRINYRYGWDGSVFRGRFKSQLVLDEAYLFYLLAYIHLNPLRANFITRVDAAIAWTSHRAYMKKEREPSWLTTKLLERFESRKELGKMILGLHRGRLAWPENFDQKTGWIDWSGYASSGVGDGPSETSFEIEELLDEICRITGVKLKELRRGIKGRRGNPARRFAVWALKQSTYMSQKAIGKALGMSGSHVSRDLRRSRKAIPEFQVWEEHWCERFPQKVSIVGVRPQIPPQIPQIL